MPSVQQQSQKSISSDTGCSERKLKRIHTKFNDTLYFMDLEVFILQSNLYLEGSHAIINP